MNIYHEWILRMEARPSEAIETPEDIGVIMQLSYQSTELHDFGLVMLEKT